MRKLIIFTVLIAVLMFLVYGCGTKSAKIQNIDKDDISYFKDIDTGLCFSAVGSRQGADLSGAGTGLGWTCVPCESLSGVKVKELK